MKKTYQLYLTFFLLISALHHPTWAEGDGGGDGGSDAGGEGYDGDGYHHHDGHGHHHHHGSGIYYDPWLWGGLYGSGLWGGYYGPGWGAYGYRGYGYIDPWYRPYYMNPPVIGVPAQPPVYIEQSKPVPSRPNAWYYCRNPEGYYPEVKQCPDGWLQVAPQPNAQ